MLRGVLRSVPLLLALALAGWLAWDACRTPAPLPANAPSAAFSARRAFADVEVIGARPHPTGSPENAKVRDWLAGRMRALGLEVRVQPGQAIAVRPGDGEPWADGATVDNVIGVLPGRDRSRPALLVMAHYDSVPASPGASDDGAGVASALETARALKAPDFQGHGPPARDVIFLLTDGEEPGLIGARAFFAGDPLARRVGAVLNMDVRGDGGRALMFETGWEGGATLERLQAERTDATSNSLTGFVYSLLPNDTDFTVAKAHGLPGMNFAFIGRQFGYHAASSTPQDLDQGALQHMGEQVLAAARDLSGPAPFPAKAPDVVYSDLLGRGLVLYPVWAGWLALAAAAGLWFLAARRAAKFEPFSVMGCLRGAAAAASLTLAIVPLGDLVRRLTGAPFGFVGERPLLAQFSPYEAALTAIVAAVVLAAAFALDLGRPRGRFALAAVPFLAGVACSFLPGGLDLPALGCGTAAGLLAVFASHRPVPAWSGWTGAWILTLAAALALQVAAPVTAFLFAWPLLAASLTAWLIAFTAKARFFNLAAVAAAIVVGALVTAELGAFTHLLIVGIGSSLPEIVAPIAFLAALVLFPLTRLFAEARAAGWAAAIALIAALGLSAFIRLHPYASPQTPAASEVLAVADTARGRFYRASPLPRLGTWSRSVLAGGGQDLRSAALPPISARPIFLTESEPFGFTPVLTATLAAEAAAEPRFTEPTYTPTQDGRTVPVRKFMEAVRALTPSDGTAGPGPRYFTLFIPPGVEALRLDLKASAPVADVRVDGLPVALLTRPGEWSHLAFTAPGDRLTVSFTPKTHGKLEARWAAVTPGWPSGAAPLPSMPPEVMPWSLSGSTVVLGATGPSDGRF